MQNNQNRQRVGGGSSHIYDPRIGNSPLPEGMEGTVNKAYTRTPQEQELVENRLTGLLDRDNPYISNARQRAAEASSSRGMLNSSLAMGAAERSAIEAGMPIAAQDAATFAQAASENQAHLNQMAQLQGQLATQIEVANIGADASKFSASMSAAAAESQARAALQRQREQLAFQGEQAGLDRNHQYGMAQFNSNQAIHMYGLQTAHDMGMAQFGLGRDLAMLDAGQQAALTQMGYGTQLQDWMAGGQHGRDLQMATHAAQLGMVGNFGNHFLNTISNGIGYGMLNPDFAADPTQMMGFIGGLSDLSLQAFNTLFEGLFGGGAQQQPAPSGTPTRIGRGGR